MATFGGSFYAYPSVESIPLLDCILCNHSPFQETLNHASFVSVNLSPSSRHFWLKVRFADYVGENDIIISPQLFSYLNSFSSEPIDSQLFLNIRDVYIHDIPVESPSNFVIRACSSTKLTHKFDDPFSWSSQLIPSSIETIICKYFSDICSSYIFSLGCQFLVPYLDALLVFEVISSDAIGSLFFATSDVNVVIEKVPSSNSTGDAEPAEHVSSSHNLSCFQSLYKPILSQELFYLSSAVRRSLFVLDAALNQAPYFPNLCYHNSILFQGAKGIGKSYLLQALFEYCHQHQPKDPSSNVPEILFLDCKEIVRQRLRPSPNIIQPDISMTDIISAVRNMCNQKSSHQSSSSKVIIFIDHLDEILSLFAEESLQDRAALSTASVNNTRHYIAFLLYHLLLNIRTPQYVKHQHVSKIGHEKYPVVSVFGATRLSVQSLPRSSSGCPEFQYVVALPKPTQKDRENIWKHIFLHYSMIMQATKQKGDSSLFVKLIPSTVPAIENTERLYLDVSDQWSVILSEATRGYLPGDLMRILETAVNIAHRQQTNLKSPAIQKGESVEMALQWEHMTTALAEVLPASVLEISLELHPDLSSSLSWNHFIGYQDTKRHVQRVMKTICYHPPSSHVAGEKTKTLLGNKASKGMVVYGVSGCGKSYLVQTMAKELKMNFVTVTGGDMLSKYFGDTEARIRSIFQRARNAAPCILYFDNFDALAHRRGSEEASSTTTSGNIGNRILSTFLNELDGVGTEAIVETDGTVGAGSMSQGGEQVVFVIVSCADISQLDEALIRPGRLQHHIHLSYPNLEDMTALLEYFFQSTNLHESVNFKQIASVIDGRSRTVEYKQKYLSVTKLMEMKEQVLSVVIEEFLQSHPEIQKKLNALSEDILLGRTDNNHQEPLLKAEDLQEVVINTKHIMQVVDKLFPEEKPAFEFTTPFSGTFSFNVGSSFS